MTTGSSGQETSPAMEQLIGKAVTDADFRQRLVDDPQEAVRSAGIDLSREELQALQGVSREERERVLTELGERVSPISVTIHFKTA
jgi:hypothetical protein